MNSATLGKKEFIGGKEGVESRGLRNEGMLQKQGGQGGKKKKNAKKCCSLLPASERRVLDN